MKKVKVDLTGKKFGRLTVIGIDDRNTRKTYWNCICDCGKVKSVRADSLQGGAIRSCGCLKKEQDEKNLTKHHSHYQSGTRIYIIWQNLKSRCNKETDVRYHNYGGRGIKVCEEWQNSFENFYYWSLENGYSDDLTIDRIDNDGNYEPLNCRWVDKKTQCNNRSTNTKITIGKSTRTLMEWCEIFQLNYSNIYRKYKRNDFISVDHLVNGNHRNNQSDCERLIDIVEHSR